MVTPHPPSTTRSEADTAAWQQTFWRVTLYSAGGVLLLFTAVLALGRWQGVGDGPIGIKDWQSLTSVLALLALPVAFAGAVVVIKISGNAQTLAAYQTDLAAQQNRLAVEQNKWAKRQTRLSQIAIALQRQANKMQRRQALRDDVEILSARVHEILRWRVEWEKAVTAMWKAMARATVPVSPDMIAEVNGIEDLRGLALRADKDPSLGPSIRAQLESGWKDPEQSFGVLALFDESRRGGAALESSEDWGSDRCSLVEFLPRAEAVLKALQAGAGPVRPRGGLDRAGFQAVFDGLVQLFGDAPTAVLMSGLYEFGDEKVIPFLVRELPGGGQFRPALMKRLSDLLRRSHSEGFTLPHIQEWSRTLRHRASSDPRVLSGIATTHWEEAIGRWGYECGFSEEACRRIREMEELEWIEAQATGRDEAGL